MTLEMWLETKQVIQTDLNTFSCLLNKGPHFHFSVGSTDYVHGPGFSSNGSSGGSKANMY